MDHTFKIKIPGGYLLIEEKGAEYEYPGVWISFLKDGAGPHCDNLIACVEYDTSDEEIRTECYSADFDEPCYIISFPDGQDVMR